MTLGQVLVVGDDPTRLMFSGDKVVALDTETTGLLYSDRMLGFSLAWWDGPRIATCWCHVPAGQMSLDELTDPLGEMSGHGLLQAVFEQHVPVFHNEAFDYRAVLGAAGLPPPRRAHDTMHLAGLVGYNERYTLEWLYGHYVGKELPDWYRQTKEDRANLQSYTLSKLARYARQDAQMTLELLRALKERLSSVPHLTGDMYRADRDFAHLVMQMVERGLPVDREWLLTKQAALRARAMLIEQGLRAQGLREIGSNEQVATFLFRNLGIGDGLHPAMTRVKNRAWPNGMPSVSEDALLPFKRHPAVQAVLEYRGLVHALGTWVEPYLRESVPDGNIHSLLNPSGTVSSRISAAKLNVQGVPMENRGDAFGSFMGLFRAKPGHRLRAFDLKQAEVRLAALCARDPNLARALASGRDPYVEMADQAWHDPKRRQDAKRGVLATIYEVGTDKFAKTHNLDWHEAEMILKTFRAAFPRLRAASRQDQRYAESFGFIPNYRGKPRWFGPEDVDPRYKAFNQRVQSGVAQLMAEAMLAIERAFPGMLLLQVHDSVVLDVPDSDADCVVPEVCRLMAAAAPPELQGQLRPLVPFLVDSKPYQLD